MFVDLDVEVKVICFVAGFEYCNCWISKCVSILFV